MPAEGQPQPGTPEKDRQLSEFQKLQQEIDNLDKAHLAGAAWSKEDREKRAAEKEQRDGLIEDDPGAQRALREAQRKIEADGWVGRITTAESPVEEIRKIRAELQANGEEDKIVDSVAVRRLWDAQKTGGLVNHYFNKALDRLEARCLMVKGSQILPPDERPLEKEDLYPLRRAEWEWKIPDDFKEKFQRTEELKDPEKAEGWVIKIQDEIFTLFQKAIAENKDEEELVGEIKAIEESILRIPREVAGERFGQGLDLRRVEEARRKAELEARSKSIPLTEELIMRQLTEEERAIYPLLVFKATRFPEGIFLKEKMELFSQAMLDLMKRTVQTVKAAGSVSELAVTRPKDVILRDKWMVPKNNIELEDWYVLTHLHKLFPEGKDVSETQIDLQTAWDLWQDVGRYPYEIVPGAVVEGDGKVTLNGRGLREVKIGIDGRVYRLKKLRNAENEELSYDISDFFSNEQVENLIRAEIAKIAGGEGDETGERFVLNKKGVRSELVAWCLLRVGLTFDMWDRERWKHQAANEVRDVMNFTVKQVNRLISERKGLAIPRTAGRYWAMEGQDEEIKGANRELLGEKEAKLIERMLTENLKRAIFLVLYRSESKGMVIGDFYHSVRLIDQGRERLLASYSRLEDIPWLRGGAEKQLFNSYVTYQLPMAMNMVETFQRTTFKSIEELKNPDEWRGVRDTLVRLNEYCPWMIARTLDLKGNEIKSDRKEEIEAGTGKTEKQKRKDVDYELKQRVTQTVALGIFWYFSYKNQPPDNILGIEVEPKSPLSAQDFQDVKDAVKKSRILDDRHYRELLGDLQELKLVFGTTRRPQRK